MHCNFITYLDRACSLILKEALVGRKIFSILLIFILLCPIKIARAELYAVASIKPIHSLVSALMTGVAKPGLIIQGLGSPHSYSLKPSQAALLGNADVVFWIGNELEFFLKKPIENIAKNAVSVELIGVRGLTKLLLRRQKYFNIQFVGKHILEGRIVRKGKHKLDYGRNYQRTGSRHSKIDPHIWLDPVNAKIFVREIRQVLAEFDPDNAKVYRSNASATLQKLDQLLREVSEILQPIQNKRFFVLHDAYQYFEARFGISAIGSITSAPELMPGAEGIAIIRERIKKFGPTCIFVEPQSKPRLISVIAEGTEAKIGVIDPLGRDLKYGPELYFSLVRNMALQIKDCLLRGP
ncbi:MAG: zinc ABC transporter substrate-binding protein [Magnetovibrio sp.]|nr:zinc ABC transporter substrate-binding protein [Magnetovibrio sp.]|tara:strand:+ start:751 stop:1806 length:1056 start_codon:yes stop_codon:yes gene_type:complete